MIDICLYCEHNIDKHKLFVEVNGDKITQGVFCYHEEDLGNSCFSSCGCNGGLEQLEFELVTVKKK